jgi:hypothetical protein
VALDKPQNKYGQRETHSNTVQRCGMCESLQVVDLHAARRLLPARPVALPHNLTVAWSQDSSSVEMSSSVICVVMRLKMVSYWRFGTTYPSHLQVSRCTIRRRAWFLKMER